MTTESDDDELSKYAEDEPELSSEAQDQLDTFVHAYELGFREGVNRWKLKLASAFYAGWAARDRRGS